MDKKIKILFLILVLVQGLHSVEEYIGKLWETFPPAIFLSDLIFENHETGFLLINIGILIFGLWCWFFPVLRNYSYDRVLIWIWVVIEMINGIGHLFWSLYEREYVPGVATAPILLILSVYLSRLLLFINSGKVEK